MSRNQTASPGFTLVELLGCIAVIVVVLSMMGPAIGSLARGRTLDHAAEELCGLIQMARAEAMTMQGCTWVALEEVADANGDVTALEARIIAAPGGSATTVNVSGFAYLSVAPRDFRTRTHRWENVRLGTLSGLKRISPPALATPFYTGGDPTSGISIGSGRNAQRTKLHTLTFTGGGHCMRHLAPSPNTPYEDQLAIVLTPAHGPGETVLLLDGLSGAQTILR